MHRDLEFAAAHLADLLGHQLGRAEQRVQRLREARGQAPAHLGLGMHDGGRRTGGQHTGQAGLSNKRTALHHHECLLVWVLRWSSVAGELHAGDQHRAHRLGAHRVLVGADADDVLQHVLQVAGNGHLVDRVGDLAVLDPVAAGAARVVAGHVVDALPHQLGHQQAATQAPHHGRKIVARRGGAAAHAQIVRAAGMAGGLQAQLARRVAGQEIALQHAARHHRACPRGHALVVEG
mmetsp:Transcript_20918/g.80503  ORF Transcript_20918/g.80503 Transcript_20918/m.80503 type:complete len:235 (+) Transcript_20918:3977-4681(+)